MIKNKILLFNAYLKKRPFISSVILASACNIFIYVSCCLFFLSLSLMEWAGIPVSGELPVGSMISAVLFIMAGTLFADIFYAVKAESRLGFFIWFIGIPILFGLFYITPKSGYFNGFDVKGILRIYYYRLLPFILVRSYSYIARDEKRKKAYRRDEGKRAKEGESKC